MQLDRRNMLKLGLSGAVLSSMNTIFRTPLLSRSLAGTLMQNSQPRKMIVIFMRGGNDGINTCIPQGDPEYNSTNRPSLFIPEAQSLDLGNAFARLHPAMSDLMDLYSGGQLAVLHRVAYANQSRSHFDSQHYWENSIPGSDLEQGWVYRLIDNYLPNDPLVAASISNQLMVMFKGDNVLPHIPDVTNYNFGSSAQATKLLGASPTMGSNGAGLLGWYGQDPAGSGYDALVKATGTGLGESLLAIENSGVNPATYVPENGATYPNADAPEGFNANVFPFFQQLRDAAILLKFTNMQVVGLELGSFDTHAAQGTLAGAQGQLLRTVAHAIRSLSLDLATQWDDTLVLTMSEFGRTSEENGSFGTDHGEASVQLVAGGQVTGGVYNCDSTTWAAGDMFSTPNGRYVTHRTDFRSVFAEILTRHFDVPSVGVDTVIPGFSAGVGDPTFDFLNFLPPV